MLSKNAPMKVASNRLGHSSIKVTIDTYSHVENKVDELATSLINDYLI